MIFPGPRASHQEGPAKGRLPAASGLSDEELVNAARNDGDARRRAQASSALFERYYERVYVWCYRMVRNHDEALDLAQEALLNAYRRLDTFEGRSDFSSWLFMVVRNRCLSTLRARRFTHENSLAIEEIADEAPGPDEVLEAEMSEEKLLALIRRHLDPLEQEAVALRVFEGIPVDDITRLLGISEATGARCVLQRARRKLRAAREWKAREP